jgi:hypothetical protein
MTDLRDDRNRRLKVDARVRGTMRSGIEVHGLVIRIWVSPKYGPVLVIDDGQHEQNVPASQCRRMYGHTNASRETAEVARAIAERNEHAAEAERMDTDSFSKRRRRARAHPKRKL